MHLKCSTFLILLLAPGSLYIELLIFLYRNCARSISIFLSLKSVHSLPARNIFFKLVFFFVFFFWRINTYVWFFIEYFFFARFIFVFKQFDMLLYFVTQNLFHFSSQDIFDPQCLCRAHSKSSNKLFSYQFFYLFLLQLCLHCCCCCCIFSSF